jgi:transposase
MKFIQGKPRNQWEMYCLDEHVDADNEVRLIDLFVDSLNLAELGFKTQYEEMAGRHTTPVLCSAFLFTAT